MTEHPRPRRHRPRPSRWSRALQQTRFFRTLKKDRLFAVAFTVILLLCAGIGLSVLSLWQTTPPDFRYHPVKVSTIDLIQSWSLSRAARRAEASGDHEAALHAWRSAAANNPGDPTPQRAILQNLLHTPVLHPDQRGQLLSTTHWLTALTGTNTPDATLIGQTLERHGAPEVALPILRQARQKPDDPLDQTLARCLLATGPTGFPEFLTLWNAHQSTWTHDTQGMALCHHAWTLATATPSTRTTARQQLTAALAQPGEPGLAAARLLQMAAYQARDAEAMAQAIQRLEQGHARPVIRHGRYWLLLHSLGQSNQARELAVAFKEPILDPATATEFLDALRTLGLNSRAQDFAQNHLPNFGMSPSVWRAYFDVLIDLRNWDELRRIASNAKVQASPRDPLFAHALYADFVAATANRRTRDAQTTATELAALHLDSLDATLRFTSGLRSRGYPEPALALWRKHEPDFAQHEPFWNELFHIGYALKDLETLRRATTELNRLHPDSPTAKSNRAALLLLSGEAPAEALELTLAGITEHPQSPTHRINRALALLQHNRPTEASPLLEGLNPSRLPADLAANYFYALALTQAAQQHPEAALATARKIQPGSLFPQQSARLAAALPGDP